MSTESVAEICSEKCLLVLESIQSRCDDIVYMLVPEKHRYTNDNKSNTFMLAVDVVKDLEDMSKLYVADSQKGTVSEVRLHYPATVKVVATGYTNPMAVAMVHGTIIVAERIGNVYCVDPHLKLQVNFASMKKSGMNAFLTRQKADINSWRDGLDENVKNHSREELKSAIHQFLQGNRKKAGNKGTLLDLQPAVKTPAVMTSLVDKILFIAGTGTRRLIEVKVEKADFKLQCHSRTVIKFKDNVSPNGLCVIKNGQKFLLADSGPAGGILMINLDDSTTTQLLQNEISLCCQICGASLSGQSVVFRDTKSHSVKRFSCNGPILNELM